MALSPSTQKMLARAGPILARLPAGQCSIVEVGVNVGMLAEHLLRERPDLEWHGVDPWHGPENNSVAYVRTNDGHAIQTLVDSERCMQRAIARVGPWLGMRATIHRAASPAAAAGFARASMTMVFIDADHSAEAVAADVEAWWPVVAPGGWLSGHDYDNKDPRFRFGVKEAVDAWIQITGLPLELDAGATWFVRKLDA